MSNAFRWFVRLLYLPIDEWRKAQLDRRGARGVHATTVVVDAEVEKLRVGLRGLMQLHREAASTVARFPAASKEIVTMLERRMLALVQAMNETPPVLSDEREAA